MFNDAFFLQIVLLIFIYLFINSTNLLVLWYISGFILIFFGFLMFLDNSDIFIGFLWLIDLGVGLVFLIFILHFSNFLYKKIELMVNFKIAIMALLMLLAIFFVSFYYSDSYSSSPSSINYLIFSFSIL